ncbi:CRP-like cAMP-binding protein [Pedobacter sp. CAN_A7]|uniref:Crp/Fnr family transcriptional regulator n=1 Tax=Pedobacter sp. CAN_A7 TaxID=2787722 RepID=UPI0018C8DE28
MHFTSFINHLKPHGPLSDSLINDLRNRCEYFNVPDKSTLIVPGQVSKYIYFINEGLLRTYHIAESQEDTMGFSGPNEFIADGHGFLNNTLSEIGVVCHSKASGVKIRHHEWKILCEDNPMFLNLSRNILLQQLLKLERESVIYRTKDTKEKIEQLCRLFPGITDIVARRHIGNFFGTTEQGISNIISQMRKCSEKTN